MAEISKELTDKAEELELNVDDYDTEDSLQDAIDEKLEADADDDDLDKVKEKLEFQKGENKKAFAARDRAKKDMRTLRGKADTTAKELKDLKEKLEGAPNAEEYDELKTQLDELLEAQQKKKESKMDDTEKQKVRFDKQLADLEKKFDGATNKFNDQLKAKDTEILDGKNEIKGLRNVRLSGEIMEAAIVGDAYNPKQIVKILSSEFMYDDKLETFTHLVRDGKGKIVDELTVEERVKAFLEDSDNDNLVKSKTKSGTGGLESGSTESTNRALDNTKGSFSNKMNQKPGEYDPKDPEIIEGADLKGLSVEDYIVTLKLRDEKMSKIRGDK